jgi:hypothetical protein
VIPARSQQYPGARNFKEREWKWTGDLSQRAAQLNVREEEIAKREKEFAKSVKQIGKKRQRKYWNNTSEQRNWNDK